ncbi:MAG: ABC transporter ATP-binding protein [Lachnospiraceae bacterium]|nr:ABC transporter ATP-binding protein [Lachnospiraceae bacterium]
MMAEKKQHVLTRLLKEMKSIAGWLVIVALLSLIAVGLELASPWLLGSVLDELYDYWIGAAPLDMGSVTTQCIVLGVFAFGQGGVSWIRMYMFNNVVSKYYTCSIRIKISDKIKRLSVGRIDSVPNGELISRMMNDVSRLGNSVHMFVDLAFLGVLKIIAIAVIVISINPVMAIPVIAFVPVSMFLSAAIARKSGKHFHKSQKLNGEIYAVCEEDYTGFETIRAFNLADRQNREMSQIVDKRVDSMGKGIFVSGLIGPVITATNSIEYIVICLLGGYLALNGTIPVGEVVTFILYAKLFSAPLESIAQGFAMVQQTIASAKRVYELLDYEEMEEDGKTPAANDGSGEVVFEDVCFSYDPAKPLIKDLSFAVKPGQKVAIVGPTGGGKTTIVNLIMRFYDVDSGRILIDGVDTRTMDRAALRGMFGMVLQDTWLFSGSIYDNIAYGSDNATKEKVYEAAAKAHLDYYINTLPEGYETKINEEASNISSGQKQLLTIARAYLSNRKMLILDEATSNVDTRTELLIQQTMDELMKGRTSFVIAHRLSTIVDADLILVVDNGRIVETGTHSELMKKNGFYREIYDSQYALVG